MFSQPVKLHHLNIKPNGLETAPNVLKLYVNKPHLDFSDVEDFDTTEEFILTEEEVKGGDIVLNVVKYTNVNKISVSPFYLDLHSIKLQLRRRNRGL